METLREYMPVINIAVMMVGMFIIFHIIIPRTNPKFNDFLFNTGHKKTKHHHK
jgi:hypothetical protein